MPEATRGNQLDSPRSWGRPGVRGAARAAPLHPGSEADRVGVRRRADEEDGRPRQRGRAEDTARPRRGEQECLRNRNAVRLELLLLGAAAHDANIREVGCDALEERGLPPIRFEQRHLAFGQRSGERQPGRTPPDPTSTRGPWYRSTRGTATSDCSTCTRHASFGSRIAVTPGVARRSSIQASVAPGKRRRIAAARHPRSRFRRRARRAKVDDLALGRAHRFEVGTLTARAQPAPPGTRASRAGARGTGQHPP